MPVSKKPRKKGKHGARVALAKKKVIANGQWTPNAGKLIDRSDRVMAEQILLRSRYGWLSILSDREKMVDSFLKVHACVSRLPTTAESSDFALIVSLFYQAVMVHKSMQIVEKEWVDEIRHGAYILTTVYRLWILGEPIPDSMLYPIRVGLDSAKALIEYAWDHDTQALLEAKMKTSPLYVELHPEETEARERLLFGERYEQIKEWKLDKIKANRKKLTEEEK